MNINFMTDMKHVRPDDWQDTAIGLMVCVAIGTGGWLMFGLLVLWASQL
jgi:hypothetical protein